MITNGRGKTDYMIRFVENMSRDRSPYGLLLQYCTGDSFWRLTPASEWEEFDPYSTDSAIPSNWVSKDTLQDLFQNLWNLGFRPPSRQLDGVDAAVKERILDLQSQILFLQDLLLLTTKKDG